MMSFLGLVRHPGNEPLFRTIKMGLLSTLNGRPVHLHAEGLRGTGKTTILRSARSVLPKIRRIKGCVYNCDPLRPHCPYHGDLFPSQVEGLGSEWVPMPFLEISHSAKIGTVVGSIDLARIVDPSKPSAALLPGTIPQAHRGIILVDEINRLAETSPELADILLDVMGTKPGRIQIEETGLPVVELPAQISIWAASNPDEEPGPLEDIRRQLSDRFDFVIRMSRPSEIACVRQILAQSDEEADPAEPDHLDQSRMSLFSTDLQNQCLTLGHVKIPDDIRGLIADIYTRFSLESLRAVEAMQLGSKLNAAATVKEKVGLEDLLAVTPLALRHRVDADTLGKILKYLQAWPTGAHNEVAGMQAIPPEPHPALRPAPHKPQAKPDPERKPPFWERLLQKIAPPSMRQANQAGAGASPQQTGKASLDGPRGGAAAEGGIGDPSQVGPVAPPFRARPVAEIPEKDLIKTEEDLAR